MYVYDVVKDGNYYNVITERRKIYDAHHERRVFYNPSEIPSRDGTLFRGGQGKFDKVGSLGWRNHPVRVFRQYHDWARV